MSERRGIIKIAFVRLARNQRANTRWSDVTRPLSLLQAWPYGLAAIKEPGTRDASSTFLHSDPRTELESGAAVAAAEEEGFSDSSKEILKPIEEP